MKTLHDGRQVDGNSDEWRHECEAITLLRMPVNKRKAHLVNVEAKRGVPERQRLQDTVMALWINKQGDQLAVMDMDEREGRMLALTRDNKEHIMARIVARMNVAMAANDNHENQPERAS